MGRSLGSAPALEIAANHAGEIQGLILESGFAETLPLLGLLGINAKALEATEENGFGNDRKIAMFAQPTLIIHAEHDHIIPFVQAERLYEKSAAARKKILMIPGANHNDILFRGGEKYFQTIADFVSNPNKT